MIATTPRHQHSEAHLEKIGEHYTLREQALILRTLSEEELKVIGATNLNPDKDYLLIARTNRLVNRNKNFAEDFSKYTPKDNHDFTTSQISWMKEEKFLVDRRLPANATEEEKAREYSRDFHENNNGVRFRIFYRLKNPGNMILLEK